MIQLAWRFSALTRWFRARTENARGTRTRMIVALARKLLIALWLARAARRCAGRRRFASGTMNGER
jgi:hypothetical protein